MWQRETYLDGDDPVKGLRGEFILGDVAGDDGDVLEVALPCHFLNVFLLGS